MHLRKTESNRTGLLCTGCSCSKTGLPCTLLCNVMGIMKTCFAYVVVLENLLFYFDPTSEIKATLVDYIQVTLYIYLIQDTGYRFIGYEK